MIGFSVFEDNPTPLIMDKTNSPVFTPEIPFASAVVTVDSPSVVAGYGCYDVGLNSVLMSTEDTGITPMDVDLATDSIAAYPIVADLMAAYPIVDSMADNPVVSDSIADNPVISDSMADNPVVSGSSIKTASKRTPTVFTHSLGASFVFLSYDEFSEIPASFMEQNPWCKIDTDVIKCIFSYTNGYVSTLRRY